MSNRDIADAIRVVDDFPVLGVRFYDITPLLKDRLLFRRTVRKMSEPFKEQQIDCVVGAESRGYFFAPALAYELNAGFVPARKPNKLPFQTEKYKYEMEDERGVVASDATHATSPLPTYRKDYAFELHKDALTYGTNVLFVDDLLAKGGTAAACCHLIESLGGHVVACLFLIELSGLGGAERLAPHPIYSLLKIDT